MRPLERVRDDALNDLRKRTVRPLVQQALATVRSTVPEQPEVLQTWLQQVERELLQHLHWFELAEPPKTAPVTPAPTKAATRPARPAMTKTTAMPMTP